MSNNIKKELKIFKKEIQAFRDISKEDFVEGVNRAKELIKKVNGFASNPEMKGNSKFLSEATRTKEALELYITNVENINKFGKKWNSGK